MAKQVRLRNSIRTALSDGSLCTANEVLMRVQDLPRGKYATIGIVAQHLKRMPDVEAVAQVMVEKQDGRGTYETSLWGLVS